MDSKPVFFLGAGASQTFGFPTTKEFMALANKLKPNQPYERIVGFLKSRKGDEQIDIELVLMELQNLLRIIDDIMGTDNYLRYEFIDLRDISTGRLPAYRNEVAAVISEINKLVFDTYWGNSSVEPIPLYVSLFTPYGRPLDVFTTNYDRVIERSFWKIAGIPDPFTDGFYFDGERLHWKEELLDNNYLVRLHKLHGSVNWRRGFGNRIVRFDDKAFTGHEDQVLLYPGWKGTPSGEPFITLHSRLRRCLLNTQVAIVVGYSFRDEYINSIFQECLLKNNYLKVVIWNPILPKLQFLENRYIAFENKFNNESIEEFHKLMKHRNP